MANQNVRMDKSKPYATVHGERPPGDPHALVHFMQEGLPYDAQGLLLINVVTDPALKKRAEAKLAKANKQATKAAAPAADDPAPGDDDADDEGNDNSGGQQETSGDVNLESWLRGEANYQWFKITGAIKQRFAKSVTNTADAVLFLVREEKIISPADCAAQFKPYVTAEEE